MKDLVAELSKETAGLKEKAQQKYEELSSMLKQLTVDVADFDTETEETITEIRKARDEQVGPINDVMHKFLKKQALGFESLRLVELKITKELKHELLIYL